MQDVGGGGGPGGGRKKKGGSTNRGGNQQQRGRGGQQNFQQQGNQSQRGRSRGNRGGDTRGRGAGRGGGNAGGDISMGMDKPHHHQQQQQQQQQFPGGQQQFRGGRGKRGSRGGGGQLHGDASMGSTGGETVFQVGQQSDRGRGGRRGGDHRSGIKDQTMSGDTHGNKSRGPLSGSAVGAWVEVTGFDPEATDMNGLKKFLATFAAQNHSAVQLGEHVLQGRKVFINLASGDILSLTKQSGRFMGGNKLLIREAKNFRSGGTSGKAADRSTEQTIQQLIKTDGALVDGILNLSGTGGQQATDTGVILDFNNVDFIRALWEGVRRHLGGSGGSRGGRRGGRQAPTGKIMGLKTMIFDECSIHNLAGFGLLKQYGLGGVTAFSFRGNLIQNFMELNQLRQGLDGQGDGVVELALANNDISSMVTGEQLHQEVQRRFRKIQFIDGVEVEPLINFGVPPLKSQLPVTSNQSVFDGDATNAMATAFVTKFIEAFDSGARDALLDVYTDRSCFSLVSCLGGGKVRKRSRTGKPDSTEQVADESPYASFDRNLKDRDEAPPLREGRANIVACFHQLPGTKHDLESIVIDGVMLNLPVRDTEPLEQQALIVHVHGEFEEGVQSLTAADLSASSSAGIKIRGFSRSFVLFPAAPDSNAGKLGWQVEIMNDTLTVRESVPDATAGFRLVPVQGHGQVTSPGGTQVLSDFDYAAVANPVDVLAAGDPSLQAPQLLQQQQDYELQQQAQLHQQQQQYLQYQ